jgi:transitional endoplasmic reticulum ATPase
MELTLEKIANIINVYQGTIVRFCQVFEIPFEKQVSLRVEPRSRYRLKEEFIEYLLNQKEFLMEFQSDFYSDKTAKSIANKINRNETEVENYLLSHPPNVFMVTLNSRYSSYEVGYKLGNLFDFLNLDKFKIETENNFLKKQNLNIIGYTDILLSIEDQLSPILNSKWNYEWGLNTPGGILLFGPPGCGKTYWASIIAKLLDFSLYEIPRSSIGSSYVDGAMINLKKIIDELLLQNKMVAFFDEFDSIASIRTNSNSSQTENSKIVNTLLQEIPNLIKNEIVIVAATNFIDYIDPAVIRPGRFDMKIPIFPPNNEEKILLIINHLSNGLPQNSKLLEILKLNHMLNIEFWEEPITHSKLYSNSLIIDLTQLIKRKIKAQFQETNTTLIDKETIIDSFKQVSAKITAKDIEFYSQFYNEVKQLDTNIYDNRLKSLYSELEMVQKHNKGNAPSPIGFRTPNIHN